MNKGIKTNKVLSLILAIAMIATMVLPMSVFAAVADPVATATVEEISAGVQTKTITITFEEAMELDATAALGTDITASTGNFGSSTMNMTTDNKSLVINIANDNTVEAGETITFVNNVIKNATDEYYTGSVVIGGSLALASIDYSQVIPTGATVDFVGYNSAPTEAGIGRFSYTVSATNYQSKSGEFEITADDLGRTVVFDVELEENDADYTSLDAQIALADAKVEADYTPASFATFEAAKEAAKGVDRTLTFKGQATIDTLATNLVNAMAGLVSAKAVNFTAVAVADDASVNYAKATKIMIVFAEPIDGSEATILDNLSIKDKIASATWKDAAKTILELTINGDLANGTKITYTTNDAIKTIAEGKVLHSVADVEVVGNLEETSALVTAADMTATIVKASAKPGANAGDKIVFVFNAPIKNNPSTITIDGKSANVVANTSNTVYELTLVGTEGYTDTTKFDYGTITDVSLNGTFGTAIAPKALVAIAVDNDGTAKTIDDEVIILFDRPTNGSTDVSGVTEVGAGAVATWSPDKTKLTITIKSNVTSFSTIDLSSMEIKDEYGKALATDTNIAVEGSFGTVTAPIINGAYAVDNDGEATISGDQIVITFDRPTNGAAIDLKKDGIISNQATTFGSASTYNWLDGNTKLVITLCSNANIENGVEIDLSDQGIMDADSIVDADIDPVVVEGSFGSSLEPKITRAIAFTQNNKHIIRTFFNTEVIAKENTTLDVYVKNFDTPKGTWTTNGISYYDIVLEEGHDELETGAVIKFEGTLVDKKTGKMELKDAEIAISGGFEQNIDMEILSLTAYSNDGSGIAKAGDRVVLVLNSEATSVASDLGTFVTEDNITWVYTLKNNNEVEIAKEITFSSIKSKTNGKTYSNMKANIGGSFGYVVEPKLLSATAYSKDGSGIAKEGDEIIVVFDSKVSGVTSSLGNVSTVDGIVWKITLGENPSITVGTTLNFAVKSVATGKEYNNLSINLGGSFGKVVEPKILSATAYSNDGSGVAKSGDKIVVVFNAPVLYVTSALGIVSTKDNIVWEIELGSNPTIVVGTELTFDVTSVTTNKDHKGLKVNLAGSFGKIVTPEIISVTAISNDGSGVAKVGDKIVVVFDTEIKVGAADAAATYVYTYTLTSEDVASDKYAIGANYSVDVWSVATGKKYTLDSVVNGSYGYSEVPAVKDVVLAEANGIETITVVFDGAIDIYEADGITKKAVNVDTLKEKNPHIGKQNDTITAKWVDEYRLEITLGVNTTTSDACKLDLTGLGIKAKATGIALEDAAISELTIKGTLIPVVKEVKASGKNIIISFSTRTNGVANISNLTALLGTGATANWTDNNKTLTIALGENYTVTNNGYIVLNGMGIYDAFSGNYHVVGQYKILGSIDSDKLAVIKVVAQSTDKSKTTAQKGDTIVIKFNSATNLKGASLNTILDSAAVDEIVTVAGGNEVTFGTGYTGTWTAYDTFVITLGGITTPESAEVDPTIAVGTTINVANVAFANGEGTMDATDIALSGSFNGREFILTNGALTRTNGTTGDYRVSVKAENTMLNMSVVPTFVCVAYKGTSPVSVMRINVDVENTIQPVFEFAEGLGITSAKVYVFSEIFGDINSSPAVLAETVEIK